MSPRPASRRQAGRGAVQGAERSLPASVGRPEARGLRSLWSRRVRSERHERRLRGLDVRHLRRSFRRHDGRTARPTVLGPGARRRPALQSRDHARGGVSRQDRQHPHADVGGLRSLRRLRGSRRLQAHNLQDLRRPWAGAGATGLLRHRAHLPVLSRPRPDDRKSVRQMRRRRPCDAGAHAVGQCSRRRRGWHAHSSHRRGRGGNARRPARRSLHFPHDQAARDLPARRRRPLLPGADLDGAGGARRRVHRHDARWNRVQGQRSRGRAVGPPIEAARQGHAGLALARFGRSLRSAQCRDAAKPHAPPARAPDRVRRRSPRTRPTPKAPASSPR